MDELIFKTAEGKKYFSVWAYIDHRKYRIGYAYTTRSGNLCIKGNKIMDKSKLGHLLINGLYVEHNYSASLPVSMRPVAYLRDD